MLGYFCERGTTNIYTGHQNYCKMPQEKQDIWSHLGYSIPDQLQVKQLNYCLHTRFATYFIVKQLIYSLTFEHMPLLSMGCHFQKSLLLFIFIQNINVRWVEGYVLLKSRTRLLFSRHWIAVFPDEESNLYLLFWICAKCKLALGVLSSQL